MPMQPSNTHHSSNSQPNTRAAARTSAAKKKWTKKLECPRMPSLSPRKASPNLALQLRRGLVPAGTSVMPTILAVEGDMLVSATVLECVLLQQVRHYTGSVGS